MQTKGRPQSTNIINRMKDPFAGLQEQYNNVFYPMPMGPDQGGFKKLDRRPTVQDKSRKQRSIQNIRLNKNAGNAIPEGDIPDWVSKG